MGKEKNNNDSTDFNTQAISTIITIIIIIVLGIMVRNWWNGLGDGNSNSGDDDKVEAYVMSQDFMSDTLTNPSSAKYPTYNKINVVQTGSRYKVEAYVECKNSLGSTVKTNYVMILEKEADGGWRKISNDTK